jgi:DNA-binding NtrC family response regulator
MAQKRRVLIVDDEPTLLRACRRALVRQFDAIVANGGAVAVDMIQKDRAIEAVICDLDMPGVSGLDVLAAIRECRPELEPRILWAHGGASTRDARELLSRPEVREIIKPYTGAELRDAVFALFEERAGIS